jgi:NAD(P)-dependent dehydrogenase (short-subunit alcohol dehydrogenase family)
MFGDREETEDGYESQFAVNHLSHFLLSHLLLNKIKRAGTGDNHARIVNVSSCAQHNGAYIDFDDLQSK